jgi:hypothetical protein
MAAHARAGRAHRRGARLAIGGGDSLLAVSERRALTRGHYVLTVRSGRAGRGIARRVPVTLR